MIARGEQSVWVGVDYNSGIRMQDYEKAVEGVLKLKPRQPAKEEDLQAIHAASTDIIGALKASHKAICEKDQQGTLTRRLLSRLVGSTLPELTALLREILEVLYLKDSPLLLTAVYPSYPALLRRFIEAQETKGAGTVLPTQNSTSYSGWSPPTRPAATTASSATAKRRTACPSPATSTPSTSANRVPTPRASRRNRYS
jgi:hypothetical protein